MEIDSKNQNFSAILGLNDAIQKGKKAQNFHFISVGNSIVKN